MGNNKVSMELKIPVDRTKTFVEWLNFMNGAVYLGTSRMSSHTPGKRDLIISNDHRFRIEA